MTLETVGLVLAILNALNAANAVYFFLCMAKASIVEWFFFNACTPSITIYLIGYFLHSWAVMAMAIPALMFYGFGGLFVFGWKGMNIIPQISHLCMTAAIGWITRSIFVEGAFREATIGFLVSSLVVGVFIAAQQNYANKHWEHFMMLMQNAGKPKQEDEKKK